MIQTTIGQLLVNDALPEEYRDPQRIMTKDAVDDVLAQIVKTDPEKYKEISHRLVQLGRHAAFEEGTTLKLSSLTPPFDKTEFIQHIDKQERRIARDKSLTPEEKEKALVMVYGEMQKFLTDESYKQALDQGNPLALQVKSKARGNPTQLTAILTTPSVFQDSKDKTIPVFVRRSYAEGLDPHEYWAAMYGARKSTISTKFCLASGTKVLSGMTCVPVAIETLKVGDIVWTLDDHDKLIQTYITAVTCVGERICSAFEFGAGGSSCTRSVEGTEEHGIFMEHRNHRGVMQRCMEPLSKAHKGRRSAVLPSGMPDNKMYPESKAKALLLGVLLGDGGLTTQQTKMYLSDELLIRSVVEAAGEHNLKLHLDEAHDHVNTYSLQEVEKSKGISHGHKTPFRAWLNQLGVLGKYAQEKTIPDVVYTWDTQAVGALVAGLWATDGCTTHVKNSCGTHYPVVTYFCTSKALVEGLKRLLELKLGVYTSPISTRLVAGDVSLFAGRETVRNYDLHGFMIADSISLSRLSQVCPVVAQKIQVLKDELKCPRKRKSNLLARFRRETITGLRVVHDIEVAHPSHRFVLANGLVVSNSTREAGALGKQLGVAVSSLVVTQDDCGTPYGIPVAADDKDNLGTVLARKTGDFPAGTVVDKNVLAKLQKDKVENIVVRSPITCNLPEGVCKQCVGIRDHGTFPEIGHHLGYNAASALAEQIAQGSLNVKHSGGQSGGKNVYSGFDVINSLAQVPKTFPNRAAVADLDGKVTKIEPAAQGGTNVYVNDQAHYVAPAMAVQVKEGDQVEQGDQLSDGIVNPADAVKYKGIGEGRRYFAERFTQVYKDSKLGVNRRNVEALARAAVDHVAINEQGGLGDFLPGDIVKYNALAFSYKPRKDAKMLEPHKAVGQYLESPALHYTLGTRITPKVAARLKQFDVESVMAHPEPVGFTPNMVAITKVPQYENDWVARLGSSYLESRLLQDVHRGAESHLHGLNPLPGLAKGTEFGRPKGKEFTY